VDIELNSSADDIDYHPLMFSKGASKPKGEKRFTLLQNRKEEST
jgi:hypothetical protein